MKILELFGGIGACSKALERLGIEYEIADYGNKAQVERDILKQENIDLKQKMIRILEILEKKEV